MTHSLAMDCRNKAVCILSVSKRIQTFPFSHIDTHLNGQDFQICHQAVVVIVARCKKIACIEKNIDLRIRM